jgi:hypothetical protein
VSSDRFLRKGAKTQSVAAFAGVLCVFAPLRETFFLPYSGRSLFEANERRGIKV